MMEPLERPWLVAVWPGMGRIAQIAGGVLVHALGAEAVAEIPPEDYFELTSVRVVSGLVQPQALPRNVLYGWKNPADGPDLLIFLGEAQPARNAFGFCDALLSLALKSGASRALTFAAMATPIRPEAAPRVFAVATEQGLLEEVQERAVEVMGEAEISGMNGLLLSAAAARGIGGVCLLGEFPFFAASVANPKASAAVLRVFAELAGIPLDLTSLEPQIADIEQSLIAHLESLERAAGATPPAFPEPPREEAGRPELSPEQRSRLESMFQAATRDRSKALELKTELDRLGVFEEYEDRFLDLFKQAD